MYVEIHNVDHPASKRATTRRQTDTQHVFADILPRQTWRSIQMVAMKQKAYEALSVRIKTFNTGGAYVYSKTKFKNFFQLSV